MMTSGQVDSVTHRSDGAERNQALVLQKCQLHRLKLTSSVMCLLITGSRTIITSWYIAYLYLPSKLSYLLVVAVYVKHIFSPTRFLVFFIKKINIFPTIYIYIKYLKKNIFYFRDTCLICKLSLLFKRKWISPIRLSKRYVELRLEALV